MHKIARLTAALLALSSSLACASGSGTLNDQALLLDYIGGPYAAPFIVTEVAGLAGMTPPCVLVNQESPLCDLYYVKLDISEELRAHPDSATAKIEFTLSSAGEYDFFLYDSAGNLVGEPDHIETPEKLVMNLKALKNGDYALHIVPWLPLNEFFDLRVKATGTATAAAKSGTGMLGGAWTLLGLLPLAGLALLRRRA